jgi:transposase
VPAVPSCSLDPLREEFLALLPPRVDAHPLGCHRPRVDDRIVLGKLVEALVLGCGYERLGDASCSATTVRRRRDEWIRLGAFDRLRLAVLDAHEKMIGLDLADVAVAAAPPRRPAAGNAPGAARSIAARAG